MAILNFSITVPDGQASRVQTALKGYLGNPSMTNPECVEGMRQEFVTRIKEIVLRHERSAAIAAAEVASYSVDAI